MVFDVTLSLSNDEVRALAQELPAFRARLVKKMTGEVADKRDSATPAFIALDRLLAGVRGHLASIRPPEKRRHERKK